MDPENTTMVGRQSAIPEEYNWAGLRHLARDDLECYYRARPTGVDQGAGLIHVIFRKAQNKIQNPAKLRRRRELIDSMGKTVQSIVETYDRDKEASALAAHVETAVAQTALLEVGAVGLGTLVTAAVLSSSLDVTGILAAGTLAIVGFFVIPYKRKQAKDNFREKMISLRTNLLETLTAQFTKEAEGAVVRLKEGVTPYTRYVRSERERVDKSEATLAKLRQRLSALRAHSQAVVGK